MSIDFSKPLETSAGDPVKYICADVIEYMGARVCVDQETGFVYSSPYVNLKIVNLKIRNIAQAWTGEGLPPVGHSVCEYRGAHQWDVWTVVNIFAEWGEGSRRVVFVDFGDGWREERDPERFRPIRTPEQIAAEERDSARTEVLNAMTADGGTARESEEQWQFRMKIVGEMLDMGYRKQVAP